MLWIIWIVCLVSVGVAVWLMRDTLRLPEADVEADAVRNRIAGFVKRQYKRAGLVGILLLIGLIGAYRFVGLSPSRVAVSFVVGFALSLVVSLLGAWAFVRLSARAAQAKNVQGVVRPALRGGLASAVAGVAFSVLGLAVLYAVFKTSTDVQFLLAGFALGASVSALFVQLGGSGWAERSSEHDVGEFDARNPAALANVAGASGDVLGRTADVFDAVAALCVGTMVLGGALSASFGVNGLLFPLMVLAFGLLASCVGVLAVRVKGAPVNAFVRGYVVTILLSGLGIYLLSTRMLGQVWFAYAGFVGLGLAVVVAFLARYYASATYRPVKSIARAFRDGRGVAQGFAVALESVLVPVVFMIIALVLSYWYGVRSGLDHGGLYGIAVAALGVWSTAGFLVAANACASVMRGASGLAVVAKKKRVALNGLPGQLVTWTRSVFVAGSLFVAVVLFAALQERLVRLIGETGVIVNVSKVQVFAATVLGAVAVLFVASLAVRLLLSRSARVRHEIARQLKSKAVLEGKKLPEYGKVGVRVGGVSAVVVLLVLTVLGGALLRAEASAGFVVGSIVSGILLAVVLTLGGAALAAARQVNGRTSGIGGILSAVGPAVPIVVRVIAVVTLVLLPFFA